VSLQGKSSSVFAKTIRTPTLWFHLIEPKPHILFGCCLDSLDKYPLDDRPTGA